jgi:protein phosphatase
MERQSNGISTGRPGIRWAAASDIGKVRQENQDTFLVEDELGLFLVSDGMGGHRGGSLASKIVAEDLPVMIEARLNKLKSSSIRAVRSVLKRTISEQNRQLRMEGTSEGGYKDMGATLVLALLRNGRAYIANMGDSRAYLLRRGRLSQRSRDHSVVSILLRHNKIVADEMENHSAQGEITKYVGMEEEAKPYVRSFALKAGDRLLLCTDGLTGTVADKDIAAKLREQPDPQVVCEELVDAANAAGGHDNVTVVIVDWTGVA